MVYKFGQIFLPFCHNSRVWQTDGRTDRILLAIPRLHYMQRGKNNIVSKSTKTVLSQRSLRVYCPTIVSLFFVPFWLYLDYPCTACT